MLRIRELREEEGKTQSEMSALLCVSRQVYANYENGVNEPSIEVLCRLAEHFRCSVDFLVGRTDELDVMQENKLAPLSQNASTVIKLFGALNQEQQAHLIGYMEYLAYANKSK